jgi:NhaB family Na+:H+ antiporter
MGDAPVWYKQAVIFSLVLNPVLLLTAGPFVSGWAILLEFVATLALALKCNPLQPGGLLFIQTMVLGMVSTGKVHEEIFNNLPVILLVLFVVTAVSFLKEFLTFVFMKVIISVKSKVMLALFFCAMSAILSSLLDALTVTAVIIAVLMSLYGAYHRFASSKKMHDDHDLGRDDEVLAHHHEDLDSFRSFLRGLVMHSAVGTMLGGILTIIGEPQNLLIGGVMGWTFVQFFITMLPVTLPVFTVGLLLCALLEKVRWLDFGVQLPDNVRYVLEQEVKSQAAKRTKREEMLLWVQGASTIALITMLVLHVAEIYVIGLILLIALTALTGRTSEHQIGEAASESAPFVFVLAIFFGIVGMVHAQHLFAPITDWVFSFKGNDRLIAYFVSTGALSAISDNVFVASLYIGEAKQFFVDGVIGRHEFENIAVAINTGTNIPSISTPNGQAAFLFLLMSRLAPLIRLSYGRMVLLALPYVVFTSLTGIVAILLFL